MPDLVSPPLQQNHESPGHPTDQGPVDLVERILAEGPLGMSAIARLCGKYRNGAATHPSTPKRWHSKGVTLTDGRVIKLDAVRLNGRLVSSRAALLRFIRAQQNPPPAPPAPATPTPTARERAAAAASAELDSLGVK
ncbi:MAG: hypothetical protein JWO38_8253 [Gemmataceae bacterium]|nr:hypothetical protein [Gemmataceae bacterium]